VSAMLERPISGDVGIRRPRCHVDTSRALWRKTVGEPAGAVGLGAPASGALIRVRARTPTRDRIERSRTL
jgi:hypothetical protein